MAEWGSTAEMLTRSVGEKKQPSLASKQHGGSFLDSEWVTTAEMLATSDGKKKQPSLASKQHGGSFLDRVWDTVDESPHMPWQAAGVELQELTRLGREFFQEFGELGEGQALEFLPLVKEIITQVRKSCPWPELEEAEREGRETLKDEPFVGGGLSSLLQ